jgi:predicted lipoprotein with Yx(FWY)xxD motif
VPPSLRSPRLLAGLAALAVALGAGGAAALAGTPAPIVKTSANRTLSKTIVVNPAGRTLYALSPETTHHLLCKEAYCLELWPPLILPHGAKLRAGKGVQGTLGLLRRSGGRMQVTLRGKPLYRFNEDHRSGEARGEGLQTFGGTWHAVTASASATQAPASPAPTPSPSPMPAPTPAPSPYGY